MKSFSQISANKSAIIQNFINVVAHHQSKQFQMDVKNAFFDGDLEEKVYMQSCWFRRTIFGLKQAPRAFFLNLVLGLVLLGVSSSPYKSVSLFGRLWHYHAFTLCWWHDYCWNFIYSISEFKSYVNILIWRTFVLWIISWDLKFPQMMIAIISVKLIMLLTFSLDQDWWIL